MTSQKDQKLNNYIEPLYMNGLRGRMLRRPMPDKKKREILLLYGHHATLERLQGLAELLNDYGAVTMPDLPGFGGMDSFYRIGDKPTLDNLADYLAAFVKLRYRNRRFTIAALSFGFLVVTRMLQKHPDIAKRVDLLVSFVGFTRYDEFTFSRPRYLFYRSLATVFSRRLPAIFFYNVILHPFVIRAFYSRTHNARHKFAGLSEDEKKRVTDFEIRLWRRNDVRTHMYTSRIMLTVDNCQAKVNLPVVHLSVKNDTYFNNLVVQQHMQVVFSGYQEIPVDIKGHSISVVATRRQSEPLVPPKLRAILRRNH